MTSAHISSGLVLHQMTSDHNRSELEIHDHSNEQSSSKLVPKVVPLALSIEQSHSEIVDIEGGTNAPGPQSTKTKCTIESEQEINQNLR
ncbi:hypothetical protein Tco_1273034 [Tanacetum coccineum]